MPHWFPLLRTGFWYLLLRVPLVAIHGGQASNFNARLAALEVAAERGPLQMEQGSLSTNFVNRIG